MVRALLARLASALLLCCLIVLVGAPPATAQLACPTSTLGGPVASLERTIYVPGFITQFSRCVSGNYGTVYNTEYDNLPASCAGLSVGFTGSADYMCLGLPDPERPASAGYKLRVSFAGNGAGKNVSEISCPGGTVSGIGTSQGQVELADGASCALSISAPAASGGTFGLSGGTLSRTGDEYFLTASTLSGGVYGGAAPGAPSVTIAAPSNAREAFTATFTFSESVTGFVAGDISLTNGTVASFGGSGSVYTATIMPSSADPTSVIKINVAAGVAADSVGTLNTAAAEVTVNRINEASVRQRTTRVIRNFMNRRADQMTANEFDFAGRLGGGGSAGDASGGGTGPATFTGAGSRTNNKMAFATSLRQIIASGRQAKNAKHARELGRLMGLGASSGTGVGAASLSGAATPPAGFDIWVRGKWARFRSDSSEGDFGLLFVGADYRFDDGFVLGMAASFDRSDEADSTSNFSASGTGWMAGPYIVKRLSDGLIFDGRVAWGASENKVSPLATYTDNFNTTRWMATAKLTGDVNYGGFNITPHAGVIYFQEDQKAYTDSNGIAIGSNTVSLGRLTFGPKISTSYRYKDGSTLSPSFGIKGIWDFKATEQINLATGLATGRGDDLRARIDGGLSLRLAGGTLITGDSFYDGIGVNSYESYGGAITVRVPLQSDRSAEAPRR